MNASPSESLVALLSQLRLATGGQVQSVAPQVARIARDLPDFDCVWLDALTRARLITPFQAAEMLAGRGAGLAVGPYVLSGPIAGPSYGRSYTAHERGGRLATRMLLVDPLHSKLGETVDLERQVERLVEQCRLAGHPALRAARRAGMEAGRVWAACPLDRGVVAARWMTENGRFPPAVVLGMARQIAAALAELEQLELAHGDLGAWSVTIDPDARVGLLLPGLRPIVRPTEGYASTDLQPEAFDTLAPERIDSGAPASVATEIYACGCLLWHLAAGRPPMAGGSTIAKLKAVHRAKAPDIEQLTVDAPPRLIATIRACMTVDPTGRPPSFADVVAMLGPPARGAAGVEQELLARDLGPRRLWGLPRPKPSLASKVLQVAAAAACLAMLLLAPVAWRRARQFAWGPPVGGGGAIERDPAASAAPKSPAIAPEPAARPAPVARRDRNAPPPAIPPSKPRRDEAVAPAAYQSKSAAVEPRLLPTDRPARLAELELRDGQTVRGAGAGRPMVVVSPAGLRVRGEGVCFENVDFVSDAGADSEPTSDNAAPALLRLEAQQAEFRGCSFQDARHGGEPKASVRPTAIAWLAPTGVAGAIAPAELRLDHCVFWNIDAAVECRSGRSLEISARETLHARSGPLARVAQAPRRNQTIVLNLANVTLRSSLAVIELPGPELESGPASLGRVAIESVGCVFAPRADGALALVDHPREPDQLAEHVEWTGHGSLVTPTVPIVAWRTGPGAAPQELAEDGLHVAGLVRGRVEFAGEDEDAAGPDAARLRRWQAPLRSSEPPGIGAGRLILPGH